jgi:hypothetical protein
MRSKDSALGYNGEAVHHMGTRVHSPILAVLWKCNLGARLFHSRGHLSTDNLSRVPSFVRSRLFWSSRLASRLESHGLRKQASGPSEAFWRDLAGLDHMGVHGQTATQPEAATLSEQV